MHTLLGYWAYTLSIGNLLIATLAVLFFLATALMLGARRSARWSPLVSMPMILFVWWVIACQGGISSYKMTHKGESVWGGFGAAMLTFIPGNVLILGATTVIDRFRQRRTRK
jgi:hypothetical protein